MRKILAESPDIDAVICATDGIAIGAMQCLRETGRRVPDNVAVAGFGDNVISSVTTPTLTTVHLYYREAGETAAKRIVERIDGKEKTTVEIKQGFKVMERGSTASDSHAEAARSAGAGIAETLGARDAGNTSFSK